MDLSSRPARGASQALWWVLWLLTVAAIAWIWAIIDGQYSVLSSRIENVSSSAVQLRQGATEVARKVDDAVAKLAPDTAKLLQQVMQVEAGVVQAHKQIGDIQGQVTQARSAAAQAQTQATEAQTQLAQAQGQAAQFQTQLTQVQTQSRGQVEQLRTQIAQQQTQGTQAQGQVAQIQGQITQLQTQVSQAQRSGEQAQDQLTQTRGQIAQLQTQIGQAVKSGEQSQDQFTQIRGQIVQLQTQIGQAEKTGEQSQGQFTQIRGQIAQLQTQIGQAQKSGEQAQAQATQIQGPLTQVQTQVAKLTSQLGQVQAQSGNVKEIGDRLAVAETSATAARQQLERRTEGLAAEVEQLKKAVLATDTARLQQQIHDADQQIAQIGTALVAIGPTAEIAQRVAALSERLKNSEAESMASQDRTARSLDALAADIDRVKSAAANNAVVTRTQERTDQLERELGQIRAALTAAAPRAEVTRILGDLSTKLRGAETNNDQVNRSIGALTTEFDRIRRLAEAAGQSGPACSAEGAYPLAVYFDVNSSRLDDSSRTNLTGLARNLENASAKGCRLMIYGYADPQGGSAANQALSLRRAVSVRNHLVDAGVDETRIVTVVGLGAEGVQRESRSASSREQDRRVVVSIVR